jgi:hypothetical protein
LTRRVEYVNTIKKIELGIGGVGLLLTTLAFLLRSESLALIGLVTAVAFGMLLRDAGGSTTSSAMQQSTAPTACLVDRSVSQEPEHRSVAEHAGRHA